MIYSSSTTTQNTGSLAIGSTNNDIIGVQIVTTGCTVPLSATSFTFNTTGTTNPTGDIQNSRVWYTGTNNAFATGTQFGSSVAAPNGSFTITGTQTLASGTNYFWLSYDITVGATTSNVVDAVCNSIIVGAPQTPTVTTPTGNRPITPLVAPTFQCSSTNWGSCGSGSYNIVKPSCVITNDLMIAHFTYVANTGDAGITPPAGWTQIFVVGVSSSPTMTAFYKIATSSEPASYSFSGTSNGADQSMAILVYRGVDVSNPIEASGAVATSGTSHTTPCVAATTDQAMAVALFGLANCSTCPTTYNCANNTGGGGTTNSWNPPTGMTERYDYGGVQNAGRSESGNDVVQPTGGCAQKTATSSTSTAGVAAIMTLRPSGGTNAYSCSGCIGAPLPVELISFTAIPLNNEYVVLNWATASEINNDYFAIERSKDAITFSQIGTMQGSGNSNVNQYYTFYDEHPYSGISYYRLRQVDFDGQYEYSDMRVVFLNPFEIINIYPNPSSDGYIQYLIGSESGGALTIKLTDMMGREVFYTEEIIEAGISTKQLSTANLAKGSYLLIITNGKMEKTQKQFIVN